MLSALNTVSSFTKIFHAGTHTKYKIAKSVSTHWNLISSRQASHGFFHYGIHYLKKPMLYIPCVRIPLLFRHEASESREVMKY